MPSPGPIDPAWLLSVLFDGGVVPAVLVLLDLHTALAILLFVHATTPGPHVALLVYTALVIDLVLGRHLDLLVHPTVFVLVIHLVAQGPRTVRFETHIATRLFLALLGLGQFPFVVHTEHSSISLFLRGNRVVELVLFSDKVSFGLLLDLLFAE